MVYEKLLEYLVTVFPNTSIRACMMVTHYLNINARLVVLHKGSDKMVCVRGRNPDPHSAFIGEWYDVDLSDPNSLSIIENHIRDVIQEIKSDDELTKTNHIY